MRNCPNVTILWLLGDENKQHTFISNNRLKIVKNYANAKQHPQAEKRENCPNVAFLRLLGDENKQHVGNKMRPFFQDF